MPQTAQITTQTVANVTSRPESRVTNNVLCKKCGELLERNELLTLQDRCLPCYKKGVRFMMMKLHKEQETHDAQTVEMQQKVQNTERALNWIQNEYKLLNGKYQILLAAIGEKGE